MRKQSRSRPLRAARQKGFGYQVNGTQHKRHASLLCAFCVLLCASCVLFPNLFAAGSPDLLVAIRNGDFPQAQKLLRAGTDVNTVDSDGTTALMHSVIESDVKMMKLLID